MTASDHLSRLQFSYTDWGPQHQVNAELDGERVGYLAWHKGRNVKFGRTTEPGEVDEIHVSPEHQHKGIGTAMWNEAKKYSPPPKHSGVQTEAGQRWARKVGD